MPNEAEHDWSLHALMKRAGEKGLVLNSEKCIIKADRIPFFGNLYTSNGIVPDQEKIIDIQEMPTSQDKDELQHFLGMMTYPSPYIANDSFECQSLRDLLKKDSLTL